MIYIYFIYEYQRQHFASSSSAHSKTILTSLTIYDNVLDVPRVLEIFGKKLIF